MCSGLFWNRFKSSFRINVTSVVCSFTSLWFSFRLQRLSILFHSSSHLGVLFAIFVAHSFYQLSALLSPQRDLSLSSFPISLTTHRFASLLLSGLSILFSCSVFPFIDQFLFASLSLSPSLLHTRFFSSTYVLKLYLFISSLLPPRYSSPTSC